LREGLEACTMHSGEQGDAREDGLWSGFEGAQRGTAGGTGRINGVDWIKWIPFFPLLLGRESSV